MTDVFDGEMLHVMYPDGSESHVWYETGTEAQDAAGAAATEGATPMTECTGPGEAPLGCGVFQASVPLTDEFIGGRRTVYIWQDRHDGTIMHVASDLAAGRRWMYEMIIATGRCSEDDLKHYPVVAMPMDMNIHTELALFMQRPTKPRRV